MKNLTQNSERFAVVTGTNVLTDIAKDFFTNNPKGESEGLLNEILSEYQTAASYSYAKEIKLTLAPYLELCKNEKTFSMRLWCALECFSLDIFLLFNKVDFSETDLYVPENE